ncbi:MAG TPA: phytochelatin synthase family protein [Aquabacterium sp.]|uniref:phytochelatin synthase family protein n=1 Tax=Aquabacterium sp. TaxID=1872578 RepID=UPI002E32731E|nr:phytochelatin synthase family protein [Aquabacterium sp.]HEX5357419.1 phytochelatin synthase family protein [Aquabacterium sp.]
MKGRLSSAWLLALVLALAGGQPSLSLADALPAAASSSASPTSVESGASPIQADRVWQDAVLLDKAWRLPVAARYKPHLEFQRNLTFCGPTSVANVGHSWGLPGDQTTMLDGTGIDTVWGYLPTGLTLDQLAGVVRHRFKDRRTTVWRGLDLPAFRALLLRANGPDRRYIVNFSRTPLFGKGGGHHSPIAGYLTQEDLVLVLDVNSDFGPWLVKPERLLAAMNTVDSSSGKPRGLLLIEQ